MEQFDTLPYVPHIIMKNELATTGWISGVINGRFFEAKVYNEPSDYGVGGFGRVSKLAIGKTSMRDRRKPYFEQLAYNYDRGLDFSELDERELNKIVAWLEKLPKTEIV